MYPWVAVWTKRSRTASQYLGYDKVGFGKYFIIYKISIVKDSKLIFPLLKELWDLDVGKWAE